MIEISSLELNVLRPLLDHNTSRYPLLKAVISNKKSGKAYVNRISKPSSAGVLSVDNWFYLLGSGLDEKFNAALESLLVKKVVVDHQRIYWCGITKEWKNRMLQNTGVIIQDYPRSDYVFDLGAYRSNLEVCSDYKVEAITEKNIDRVFESVEGLVAFWESKTLFLESGFGYVLYDGDRIIGHSISASVEDLEVEIDIKTEEAYRGKGLAKYLATCLIDTCLSRSLTPKWDCGTWNLPSERLAVKLGFKKVREYAFSIIQPHEG